MLILLHDILDICFGFVIIKCKFLSYFAKFWNATRLETCRYGCCFDTFVAWLTRSGGGSDSHIGLKMVLALHNIGRDLHGSQIKWVENCMEKDMNKWAAKCAGCKLCEPTQSAGTALWMRGTPSARTRAKCAGRTECVERWVGRTVHTPPLHLPCNAHAMQPRFHSRGPRWAAIARHVKG